MPLFEDGFDIAEGAKNAERPKPVPNGTYKAMITGHERKPNKKQTGTVDVLTFQIADGEFKGRKLLENLNMQNPNQTAVEIARNTLAAIVMATVGNKNPGSINELFQIPLLIDVVVDGEYNRIKKYHSIKDAPQQQQQPQTVGSEDAPW